MLCLLNRIISRTYILKMLARHSGLECVNLKKNSFIDLRIGNAACQKVNLGRRLTSGVA